MITSERIGWLLAIGCCVILPLFSDEPALALAGGGALALLFWGVKRGKNGL